MLTDQARAALVPRVYPQPIERDAQRVTYTDQKVNMGNAPDPPRDSTAQPAPSEVDYRATLADLCQAAGMLIAERTRHGVAA